MTHPDPAAAPSQPPTDTLDEITRLLGELLPSITAITCFASRWQLIRSRLSAVGSLLSEISNSPHWEENTLLPPLLLALLDTIRTTETLCRHCRDASSAGSGKLLMQSDLDMTVGWLSKQTRDLELLVLSGVLHHSTMSCPNPSSSRDELAFFVKDIFTRLQIGGFEVKRKALDSLVHVLSKDDKSAAIVAREGNFGCLISLLDLNSHDSLTESAVQAVSLLAASGDLPRTCLFEGGALAPLLRTIETSSATVKEKAAAAVETLTADINNAWAVSAYGGVPILLELCKSGSLVAQSHAIGAIRNASAVEDTRAVMAEEGAVPVLLHLLVTGSAAAQAKSASCIAILASSVHERFPHLLLRENGVNRLLNMLHQCPPAHTSEHVLRALHSLSSSTTINQILSESTPFILQIGAIVNYGNAKLKHISASLLANLSIADPNKASLAGSIASLVKLMGSVKPEGVQEIGAKALISLLSVPSNRKAFVNDGKSLKQLVQMLDPKNEAISKKFPVVVVAAVLAGRDKGCRKRLSAAGVDRALQRLVEMDVAGARKALQRLSGSKLTSVIEGSIKVSLPFVFWRRESSDRRRHDDDIESRLYSELNDLWNVLLS